MAFEAGAGQALAPAPLVSAPEKAATSPAPLVGVPDTPATAPLEVRSKPPVPVEAEEREPPRTVRRGRFGLAADVLAPSRATFGPLPWSYGLSLGAWIDLDNAVLQPRVVLHYGGGASDSHLWDFGPDVSA